MEVSNIVNNEALIRIMISVSVQRVLKHSNQNEMRDSVFKWKIIIIRYLTKE